MFCVVCYVSATATAGGAVADPRLADAALVARVAAPNDGSGELIDLRRPLERARSDSAGTGPTRWNH